MSTLQERLNIKRAPLDTWSAKEKLYLALAVLRIGDQNWMSVSRSLKPFQDSTRPKDWFSQRNCAQQYGSLLELVETPKRKKRSSASLLSANVSTNMSPSTSHDSQTDDTPGENIVKKLTAERIEELQRSINNQKSDYQTLRNDIQLLQNGQITEVQLRKMYQEIQEEERMKEVKALEHIKWLNERENKKLELERAWRPVAKTNPNLPTKRKLSELNRVESIAVSLKKDSDIEIAKLSAQSLQQPSVATTVAPSSTVSSSPLLSSLLKSPTSTTNFHSNLFNTLLEKDTSDQLPSKTSLTPIALRTPTPVSDIARTPTPTSTSSLIESPTVTVPVTTTATISSEIESKVEDVQDIITIEIEQIEDDAADEEIQLNEFSSEEQKPSEQEELPQNKEEPLPELKIESHPVEKLEVEQKQATGEAEPEIVNEKSLEKVESSVNLVTDDSVKAGDGDNVDENETKAEECVETKNVTDMEIVEKPDDLTESPPEIKNVESNKLEADKVDVEKVEIEEKTDSNNVVEPEVISKPDKQVEEVEELADSFKSVKVKRDYTRNSKLNRKADYDYEIILLSDEFDEELTVTSSTKKKDISVVDQPKQSEEKSVPVKGAAKTTGRSSSSLWNDDEVLSAKQVLHKRLSGKKRGSIDTASNSPSPVPSNDDERESRALRKSFLLLYNRIASHKYSNHFVKPITDEVAPKYSSVIKQPMDLTTIKKNIDNGSTKNVTDFKRDVLLMFNNAFMYNDNDSYIFNEAVQMQKDCLEMFRQFVESQSTTDSSRRETRKSMKPAFKSKK